jgi:hypothetical protein
MFPPRKRSAAPLPFQPCVELQGVEQGKDEFVFGQSPAISGAWHPRTGVLVGQDRPNPITSALSRAACMPLGCRKVEERKDLENGAPDRIRYINKVQYIQRFFDVRIKHIVANLGI